MALDFLTASRTATPTPDGYEEKLDSSHGLDPSDELGSRLGPSRVRSRPTSPSSRWYLDLDLDCPQSPSPIPALSLLHPHPPRQLQV